MMNRWNNEGKKIIFFICLILVVMVSVTSITYAYFALTATDNSIVGLVGQTGLDLDVEKVFPLSGDNTLVPQLEESLTKAISTQYSCIDDNGNAVCQVYRATITNTSTAAVKLNGTISFTGIDNMHNLKWKRIKDERIIGGYLSHNATTTDAYFERNELFDPNESMTYYFVVWIDEIETTQTDSGTFRTVIKFNSADGDGLTSTVVSMSYMVGFSSGSDYSYYRSDTYREKIKNVYFVDYIDTTGAVANWDMSDTEMNEVGSVMAWLKTNTSDNNYYDLYIGSEMLITAKSCYAMFAQLTNVEGIYFDNFDTRETIGMTGMFSQCYNLIYLDVSNFDTTKVTSMRAMFQACTNISILEVGWFDTSNVTNMQAMFSTCISLINLDVSGFDTSKVTSMRQMFCGIDSDDTTYVMHLNYLDVSGWDTSNVTTMAGMFQNCIELTTLDVSKWNVSNVIDMQAMFIAADGYIMSLTSLDLSKWNMSSVTIINGMFENCAYLTTTLTIRNANVTNYNDMFLEAATSNGSLITVNYTSGTSSLVDSMIATKSENSNVVKGSLVS